MDYIVDCTAGIPGQDGRRFRFIVTTTSRKAAWKVAAAEAHGHLNRFEVLRSLDVWLPLDRGVSIP